jgi:uncharacterized protein YabE (DUF348 family)
LALNLAGLGINLAFGNEVTVYVEGQATSQRLVYGSVSQALAKQDISINPRDRISHDILDPVTDNMVIWVDYARPVDLTLNGQLGQYWTYSTTVAGVIDDLGLTESSLRVSTPHTSSIPREGMELTVETGHDVVVIADGETHEVHGFGTAAGALKELGLIWDDDDLITPDASIELTDGLEITLTRVDITTINRDVEIPFEIEDTKDSAKPKGVVTISVAGVKGSKNQTVDQVFHDGVLFEEKVLEETILTEPVTQVQTTGTKPPDVLADVAPGSAQAIAYEQVKERGWSDEDFQCLVNLWQKESGWRVNAQNRHSGAYGIPQALPGSKMASAGADWQTNPATQIKWGLGYIKGRYTTPCGAWNFFLSRGWY